jgi:3-hydroxymyristoyl/3-hydroxydecanoyl-(acyl carrier protein) dehydratase
MVIKANFEAEFFLILPVIYIIIETQFQMLEFYPAWTRIFYENIQLFYLLACENSKF